MVRAGRRSRGDTTTAFFLGPAASSARGAATQQSVCVLSFGLRSAALLVAASAKIAWRLVRSWSLSRPRCREWWPLRREVRSAAAARIASAGVTAGLVKYLCLKNTMLDILVAFVLAIETFQHLECSGEVPRTHPLDACSAHVRRRLGLSCTSVSMPMGTKGRAA